MRHDISAVILAKNEAKNIKECLKCLKFCDEILVIDDYSEDNTREIAKSFGARVINRHLNNNFASQRNFALTKVKNCWVLFIDADERVSSKLAREIKEKIRSSKYKGFYIRRKDTWLGKKLNHGEWARISLLRLGLKSKGRWSRSIHEVWNIRGKIGYMSNFLDHYPHMTIFETLEHTNFHSSLHAEENEKEGKKANIFGVILYPIAKFTKNYFLDFGFLDGTYGFVLSIFMSLHSYLAWSDLWLKKQQLKYKNS